ncbi:MAG: glycosyl hydrolase family 28-related protein [Candidatus Obscuribacterales bacterium]
MSMRISTTRSRFGYLWAFAIFALVACSCAPAHATTVTNVKFYGAVGDGVHDDSDAIYTACRYIQTLTYKNHDAANAVYFPKGKYRIGKGHPKIAIDSYTLKGEKDAEINLEDPNAEIDINGRNAQLLNVTINNTGTQKISGVNFTATINALISGITLNGWDTALNVTSSTGLGIQYITVNIPSGSMAVQVRNQSSVNFSYCNFNGSGSGWAIRYNPLKNTITADQCSFNNVYYGALGYNNSGITPKPGSLTMTNSKFDHCYASAEGDYLNTFVFNNNVVTNTLYGTWAHNTKTSTIQNNQIVAPAYYGIYIERSGGYTIAGSSSTISGNSITNVGSGYYGIYVQGSNVTISDNTLTGNNAMYGIFAYNLALNGNNIVFKNNKISNFSYGISSEYCHDTQSINNTISGMQNNAIYSYHDTQLTADGNKLSNCGLASGAYSVIYVIGADSTTSGQNYTVKNNSYTAADTSNLNYYIYVDAANNADVHYSNNTTNTLLSNYP